ncbi:MAG: hypothetical protein AVDCRST_MAG17-579, partial [uncultured Solirubrobacterales bacterium]
DGPRRNERHRRDSGAEPHAPRGRAADDRPQCRRGGRHGQRRTGTRDRHRTRSAALERGGRGLRYRTGPRPPLLEPDLRSGRLAARACGRGDDEEVGATRHRSRRPLGGTRHPLDARHRPLLDERRSELRRLRGERRL